MDPTLTRIHVPWAEWCEHWWMSRGRDDVHRQRAAEPEGLRGVEVLPIIYAITRLDERHNLVNKNCYPGTHGQTLWIRTLRVELQDSALITVAGNHALLRWIERHVAWALQRFHSWRGGATPQFKKHGAVLEFGQRCSALIPEKERANNKNHGRHVKFQYRFEKSVCLGKTEESDEHIVVSAENWQPDT